MTKLNIYGRIYIKYRIIHLKYTNVSGVSMCIIPNFLAEANTICEIKENYPLSNLSTFKIGGNAELCAFPKSHTELVSLLTIAKKCSVKARVFGNASNVLFSSHGVSGLVIFTTEMKDIALEGEYISADCGAKLSALCNAAAKNSLCGLEFAYGIPGTVGGAVYMNAGAHGGEISHILVESICLDTGSGTLITLSAEEHGFAYRKSVFQEGKLIVLSSRFKLCTGNRDSIGSRMKELSEKRRASQPLDLPNAGSIFKRPAVGFSGKYIEDAGLKGFTVGGAQVSVKHAGFIVNIGGATSDDVLTLIQKIKDEVVQKFSVSLETEIIYID